MQSIFEKVSHNLLGIKGAKLKDIKNVHSQHTCNWAVQKNDFKIIN